MKALGRWGGNPQGDNLQKSSTTKKTGWYGEGMDKSKTAVIKVLVSILSNVAAISIGVAFFEQKWWALFIAIIAALFAVSMAWRSEL